MSDDGSGAERHVADDTAHASSRRPEWVSDELFPFESRFAEIGGHVIHYVDEGDGPALVMYHGNPTWSFAYRTVIDRLRSRFRCVAFDYPGFGLSRAAPGYDYSYRSHLDVSTDFVDHLDLDGITAFVQDWGGPIGLGVATRRPGRHRALVMGNTFAWPVEDRMWRAVSWLLGGPPGRLLVDRGNFLARTVGNAHRIRSLDPVERAHYTRPFPTPEARRATRAFIAGLRTAGPELAELAAGLPSIARLPTLILWATSDRFYGRREQGRLESLFPNHLTHVIDGAGHFLQSDAGDEVATTIASWFESEVATRG